MILGRGRRDRGARALRARASRSRIAAILGYRDPLCFRSSGCRGTWTCGHQSCLFGRGVIIELV